MPGDNQEGQQLQQQQDTPSQPAMLLLDEETLATCFHFLGPGHFLLVGGTCKRWHNVYLSQHPPHTSVYSCVWTDELLEFAQQHRVRWTRAHTNHAAAKGRLAALQRVFQSHDHMSWNGDAYVAAAMGGHLDVLQWLRSAGCPLRHCGAYGGTTHCLACAGHPEPPPLLPASGSTVSSQHLAMHFTSLAHHCVELAAASGGHVAVLRWASEHPEAVGRMCETAFITAARKGLVHVLEWAAREREPAVVRNMWLAERAALAAARNGHLGVLHWLHDAGWLALGTTVCTAAAEGGHLAVLEWARSVGCAWDAQTCSTAAAGGHLHVLQFLRANGCEWSQGTCGAAARGGHLGVLQWCRENGCPWGTDTCWAAAEGGHLGVLRWARAHGCEWNESVCDGAACGGHLEVLKWARAQGCPWSPAASVMAATRLHLEVFQWARDNGSDCHASDLAWARRAEEQQEQQRQERQWQQGEQEQQRQEQEQQSRQHEEGKGVQC